MDRNDLVRRLSQKHWHEQYVFSPAEYERRRRKAAFHYRKLLPPNREIHVLDVGCSGGFFLRFLQAEGFAHIRGVDTDADAVALCRQHVTPNAEVADAFEYLTGHPNRFDLISCHHVIEHFTPEQSLLLVRHIFDAVSPGGKVLVSVPNGMSPWAGYHTFDDLTHDHLYTSGSLRETLEIAGFSRVEVYPEGPVPYDVPTTIRYGLWKAREALLKFTFMLDVGIGRAKHCQIEVSAGLIATGYKDS
ncbi:MAG: class I SAM-dependent methyltransferase [Bryobacteraceae bacterium]